MVLQASLSKFMYDLCGAISDDFKKNKDNQHDTSTLTAVDIASGYHSYLLDIKRWHLKVCNNLNTVVIRS